VELSFRRGAISYLASIPACVLWPAAELIESLELDFFDSYVPELPDDDDFMDLVVEAAQRHG